MKVHDKYVIEIEEMIYGCEKPSAGDPQDVIHQYARIKGFNTLFFDQHVLDKLVPLEHELEVIKAEELKKVYDDGLHDAWKAAKKLFSDWSESEIARAFPDEWNEGGFKALMRLDPQIAIDRMKCAAVCPTDNLRIGDEVKFITVGGEFVRGVVIKRDPASGEYTILGGNGSTYYCFEAEKTGRHFDQVKEMLRDIRGE